MYNFIIDTDSEKLSSVNVYADKEKTKRIAAPLDAVGRFVQTVKIGFIGSRVPEAGDSVKLVVAWDGLTDSVLQSVDANAAETAYIEQAGTPTAEADVWEFPVDFRSAALEAALSGTKKIVLRGAVSVDGAAGTHVEYHFRIGASASIFAGGVKDPQTAPIEFVQVRRLTWLEYQQLETVDAGILYVVTDAPDVATLAQEAQAAAQEAQAAAEASAASAAASAADAEASRVEALEQIATERDTIAEDATAAATAATFERISASFYLLETVPAAGTSNADAYGYIGTLRDLGAFGGAVDVRQLTVYRRTAGTQANGDVALWARILKNVGGSWTVAAQSTHSVAWNDSGFNVDFTMAPVAGVTPPSADEKIAIVFVSSATAAAGASNGTVSFRTVDGSGGFTTALGADANTASSNSTWRPRTKLRFAALPGAEECATKGDIEDLKTGDTYLLQRISALETRVAALEGA